MRLKEIRKSKGISQLKMAMDLNTNQNTISRYETGEREPGINELIKIADYFRENQQFKNAKIKAVKTAFYYLISNAERDWA